jgi:tRNA (guanine37-N1)-methyltransferase
VPDVLVSGHHAEVARWRRAEAERITSERRPDLWAKHESFRRAATNPTTAEITRLPRAAGAA